MLRIAIDPSMQRRLLICLAAISFASAEEKVTFDDQAFSIFQQSCLNCHNPDKTKGGLDLSTYSGVLKGSSGGKIVEPGDVASTLISSIQHTGEHKMPPEGDKLPSEQIELLKQWVVQGLMENKSSSAKKPSKQKFETTFKVAAGTRPEGPAPMPEHLLLEPVGITARAPSIHSIATSPWAPLLAIAGHHQILLHHTQSLELLGILPFPEGDPVSLSFTPDGRYLIAGGGIPGKSGTTVTFDITKGTRSLTAAKEFDSILASDIRPGFDLVATGGPSRLLKLWNTESGSLLKSIKKHTDWITSLDFSPDGILLASGDRNGGVWVWESETGSEFHTLRGHQAAITAVRFRADSNLLATASEDGSVRFWEMAGGSQVKKIDAHPGGVTAFAFGSDGSCITAGRDQKAKLWKSDFGLSKELPLPSLPTDVSLDFEGKRAFVAGVDGIIQVFQTIDGKTAGQIHANPPTIESRISLLENQLSHEKQSLETITKNPQPAKTDIDSAQTKIQLLVDSIKRWKAAAINTRLIRTRQEVEDVALTLEDAQNEHLDAVIKLQHQADVLNRKRAERDQLAALDMTDLSPESQDEREITLDAVAICLERESDAYQQSEKALVALRFDIEQNARLKQQKVDLSNDLRSRYNEHLK
jgi:mono/diheme cytochrome c family protein